MVLSDRTIEEMILMGKISTNGQQAWKCMTLSKMGERGGDRVTP